MDFYLSANSFFGLLAKPCTENQLGNQICFPSFKNKETNNDPLFFIL